MAIWLSTRNGLERSAPESLQWSPWARDWLVGMASTALTDACTFPLDTLKKNLQARPGREGGGETSDGTPSHASSLAPCPCPLALPSALSDLSRPRPRPDTAPPWPSCLQADGGSFPALARRLLLRGGWPRLYSGYGPRLAMQAVSGGLWNWVFVRGQELFSSQGWT